MPPATEECIGDRIKRVEQELTSTKHAALRPFKINVPQYNVLLALLNQPGLSGAALARRGMVTPQTMSSVLSTLEGRGLVERWPHPVHLHILEARLTRTGKALVLRAGGAVREVEALLADCLDPHETKAFLAQLERCFQALAGYDPAASDRP